MNPTFPVATEQISKHPYAAEIDLASQCINQEVKPSYLKVNRFATEYESIRETNEDTKESIEVPDNINYLASEREELFDPYG